MVVQQRLQGRCAIIRRCGGRGQMLLGSCAYTWVYVRRGSQLWALPESDLQFLGLVGQIGARLQERDPGFVGEPACIQQLQQR